MAVDRSLARDGGLSYLEIPAKDALEAGRFYERVLGWRIMAGAKGAVKFMDRTGHLLGKFVEGREAGRGGGWLPYFYVVGIREVVKRAVEGGGEVVKEVVREGDTWVGVVRDGSGNLMGVWEEAEE